tara:strand:- start:231 stop:755 length:525 start_codon:yes stop_codon:yes gene_type:complete
MVDITDEEFRQFALRPQRPIPGQSLTTNPDTPWAWERPPLLTNKDEALAFFLELFTEEERFAAIIQSLEEGVPVMDLVQLFLIKSFRDGEINPNLMLLLAEPLAFMIMALGERAGVDDIKIVEDPDDPDIDEVQTNQFAKLLNNIKQPEDDEDFPIEEKIEEVNFDSLLAKGEE